jgi:asparagine synthase (glutamine-hydrolysing)
VIPLLPEMYDEPFADSSQIPTYLVSKLARTSVTVSLSGDGGDELFGGYNRYVLGRRLWSAANRVPWLIRPAAGALLRALPASKWDAMLSPMGRRFPALRERVGERLHKFSRVVSSRDRDALYQSLVTQWEGVVPGLTAAPMIGGRERAAAIEDITERMMYFDQTSYLVDDVLVKVDRASMAASLEAREPLLDHRLVEFAWSLPLTMKLRSGKGKWLLRRLLERYLPVSLIERPKMGFAVPLGDWLRGPLRDWADALLGMSRLRQEGWFDARLVRAAWETHIHGGNEWQQHLWTILMFQAWLDAQKR